MKAKRIALAILLSVLMVVSAVLVVACKPDDPKKDDKNVKIDLLNAADWDGFNDETNYTISNNTDGSLQVDYEKSDTYQLFTRTMVDPIDDLAKIKKLVAKVKMTSDQTTPELMFKFEGSDDPAAAEVTIQVGSDYATYEWTLGQYTTSKPYDLSKASALRVFADPGDATAKGSITFSEFYLSSEDPVAANTIKLPEPPAPPKPEDHVWKEITADDTSVVDWEDGGMGVYTITKDASSVKAVVDKDSVEGDTAWTAMISYIYGDALATMKSFRIDIKGTAGTTAFIKPLDYHDFAVTFDGTVQHFEFDISAQASRADADFSQKDAPTSDNRVAIIALNGAKSGTAELEISLAEFSTEEAKNDTPTPTLEVNEITATNKTVNKAWYDGGDGVYEVEKQSDGSFKVSFDKNGFEYPTVKALVKGSAIADMTTIKFTIRGTNGMKLILKPFNQSKPIETDAVLTGGDDEFKIDISSYVAGKTFDVEEPILIMAEGGNKTATGEFTIVNVEFGTDAVTPQPEDVVNEITLDNRTANGAWYDAGDKVYTIDKDGSAFNVEFTKTDSQTWSSMKAYVRGAALAQMKSVVFTISGDNGLKLLLKPFNDTAIQQNVDLDGTEQRFEVSLGEHFNGVTPSEKEVLYIFAAPNQGGVSGSFRIVNVEFSTEEAGGEVVPPVSAEYPYNLTIDANKGWTAAEGSRFTVGTSDGHPTISWTAQQNDYSGASAKVALGTNQYNYAVFEVKGTQGVHAIFRFGGVEYKFDDGFEEPFTGDWQTAVIKLTTPVSGEQDIIVMGGFKNANDAGTVEIRRAQLFYVANFVDGEKDLDVRSTFNASGNQNYTIENGADKTTISYTKPNTGWEPVMTWIDFGEGGYDKLTVTVKGIQGHVAVFSLAYPDDSSKLEKKFEKGTPFTGESETFEMDCSTYKGLVAFRIYLDFETITGVNENGGSIEITQAVLHKAA